MPKTENAEPEDAGDEEQDELAEALIEEIPAPEGANGEAVEI